MVQSTAPNENCSDNIEEGPLAAASLLQVSSPTATLSSCAGLELIGNDGDDDESPLLTNMLGKINSEVGCDPSANRINYIPPSTLPWVTGTERIEIADDDVNGPELLPSMLPAATLEMEEAGSYSKKRPSEMEIDDDGESGPELPPSMMPATATLEMEEAGSYSKKRPSEMDICDDGDSGPELPPSMMPAATLEMEEVVSYSKKMVSASNCKVETIDDEEDAIGENVDGNQIDVDDDNLAEKLKSDSGCNSKRRSTESSTQDNTIDNGDDSTRANVCGITDFPSGRRGNAGNWEQYPQNPAHISNNSTAHVHRDTPRLHGASRVPGIIPEDEAGADVESSGATPDISVPLAVPVTMMTRSGHNDNNFIVASRVEPRFKRWELRQLLVTLLIVVVGSAIVYVVIIRKSAFDSPPIGVNSTRYACVANTDCDDGIWCNGMCSISGNLSSFMCANNHCTCTHTFHIDKRTL